MINLLTRNFVIPKTPVRLTALLIILLTACGNREMPKHAVSLVGDQAVSYGEFMVSFLTIPHFKPNSTLREARLAQLEYLNNRMFLFLAAEKDGLGKLPEMLERVEYIHNKETLKNLYEQEILDKIPVSDAEAWEEYRRNNIELKLRHLYAENKEQAQRFYQRLQNGETFESLAREAFRDTLLANNGGDLGFLTINDLDPLLADSVFNARLGIPTRPLKSSFGYHIFRVDDVKQYVFLSREYFEENKAHYVNGVRKRRARAMSDAYVKFALKGKSVTIKSAVLAKMLQVNQSHIRMKRRESPIPTPKVTDIELALITRDSKGFLDQKLVEFTGGSWTVKEFLEKLRIMPPMQRPEVIQQKALTNHIIDMVRDHFLLEAAKRKGYDRAEKVTKAVTRWRRSMLAGEFEKRIQYIGYKKDNPQKWEERRALYQQIKTNTPVKVDTTELFKDVSPSDMQKRIPAIPLVIREFYEW